MITFYAVVYMILHVGNGAVAIPYSNMEQCKIVAEKIVTEKFNSSFAYCIEGNKS